MAAERKAEAKADPLLQVCVFDARRGEKEGQELDKVLDFYPTSTANDAQMAVIGLAQAAQAFSATFKPVSVN